MATSFRKQPNDLTECSVCDGTYKEPRVLPCLDSFCLVCCEGFCRDKGAGDKVECPRCRGEFTIPEKGPQGLRKNHILEKLMHINQPCTSMNKNPEPSLCDKHNTKTIDLYCYGCKKAICTSCLTEDHQSHDVRDLDKVIEELRATLNTGVENLQVMYDKIEPILRQTDREEGGFMTRIQRLEDDIKEEAQRLRKIIDNCESELLDQVLAKKNGTLKDVHDAKKVARQQMTFVSSLRNYIRELLNSGSASDVAREASRLQVKASKLLQSDERENTSLNQLSDCILAFTPRFMQSSDMGSLIGSVLPLKAETVSSLSEDNFICGLTVLNKYLYVNHSRKGIAVYNADTYGEPECWINSSDVKSVTDLVSCRKYRCLYICDYKDKRIRKVQVKEVTPRTEYEFTNTWSTEDEPRGLSVNSQHILIVTCPIVRKIRMFTTNGLPHGDILLLPPDIAIPWHTIQLTCGNYVVCHGGSYEGVKDPLHQVCIIDGKGKVEQSFGSHEGSGDNRLSTPTRLAEVNGMIFVTDMNNDRVILFSEQLRYVGAVKMSSSKGYRPLRLCFDQDSNRLYVGECKFENDRGTKGLVTVYSLTGRQV